MAECDRFARHLIGAPPPAYVRDWYARGLDRFPGRFAARGRVDAALLAMSGWRWLPLRVADVTSRFLAPAGALRRRLVFLTAILENAPASWETYETPTTPSRVGFFAGLAARLVASGLCLVLGVAVAGIAAAAGAGE